MYFNVPFKIRYFRNYKVYSILFENIDIYLYYKEKKIQIMLKLSRQDKNLTNNCVTS